MGEVKSAHALRLPFVLRPLSGARNWRPRRRQLLGVTLVLLLAGGTAGLTLLLRAPSNPGAGGPTPSAGLAHGYHSPLGWSMRYPSAMHVEHASANGISYAVDEVTFSNFRSRPGVVRREIPNGETIRLVPPRAGLGRFPARGIAARVLWFEPLGSTRPEATGLPLQLSSFRVGGWMGRMYSGTHPRPLQHLLFSQHERYIVQVWIGPNASARQRALLARMIGSITVRKPQSRS